MRDRNILIIIFTLVLLLSTSIRPSISFNKIKNQFLPNNITFNSSESKGQKQENLLAALIDNKMFMKLKELHFHYVYRFGFIPHKLSKTTERISVGPSSYNNDSHDDEFKIKTVLENGET